MNPRRLVAWLYPPVMLFGFNGAAIALVAGGSSHAWLALLLVAALGTSFVAERLIPYREDWNRPQGDVTRDAAHAFVNESFALGSVSRCRSSRASPRSGTYGRNHFL